MKVLHDFIIAVNIAHSGRFRTDPGLVFVDEEQCKTLPGITNDIYEAVETTQHIG